MELIPSKSGPRLFKHILDAATEICPDGRLAGKLLDIAAVLREHVLGDIAAEIMAYRGLELGRTHDDECDILAGGSLSDTKKYAQYIFDHDITDHIVGSARAEGHSTNWLDIAAECGYRFSHETAAVLVDPEYTCHILDEHLEGDGKADPILVHNIHMIMIYAAVETFIDRDDYQDIDYRCGDNARDRLKALVEYAISIGHPIPPIIQSCRSFYDDDWRFIMEPGPDED